MTPDSGRVREHMDYLKCESPTSNIPKGVIMIVKELIKILESLPSDIIVLTTGDDGYIIDIGKVEPMKVAKLKDGTYENDSEYNPNIDAVMIW